MYIGGKPVKIRDAGPAAGLPGECRAHYMRRLGETVPVIVLGAVVGVALWSCLSNLAYLLEVGGWYAVFGRFVLISVMLSFVVVAGAAVLAMIVAPVLVLFAFSDPNAEFDPAHMAVSFDWRKAGGTGRAARRTGWRITEAGWRTAWRCGRSVARLFRRPPD